MQIRTRLDFRCLAALGLLVGGALTGPAHGDPPTGAGRVHALTAAETGGVVTVRGVVTYSNPPLLQFYLQDETGGVLVRHTPAGPTPAPGQRVEAVGKTVPVGGRGTLAGADITYLGPDTLPTTPELNPAQIQPGGPTGRLVAVRGLVRHAYTNEFGRFTFELFAGGTAVPVWFREAGLETDPDRWVGATVVVRGVLHPATDRTLVVLAQAAAGEPARIDRAADPIEKVPPVAPGSLPKEAGTRVRVQGQVGPGPTRQTVTLTDRGSTVTVHPVDPAPRLIPGERAEAVGFVEDGAVQFAVVRALLPDPGRAGQFIPVLHTARDLRRLPPEEAARKHPVRLRGIATQVSQVHKDFFFQDATGAVYVDEFGPGAVPAPGDFVEVTGVTNAGSFTAQVNDPVVRVLAPGKLPVAEPVSAADVMTGRLDARWVVVEGVVQSARPDQQFLTLKLMTRLGAIDYRLPPDDPGAGRLIGARVRAQGAYAAIHNNDRRAYGFRLYAPGSAHLEVIHAGDADPFAGPVYPVGKLLEYNPDVADARRVRVEGTVTAVLGPTEFYVQDAREGILVRTTAPAEVQVGAGVRAAGFLEKEGPTVVLADAVVRPGPAAPPPGPEPVAAGDIRNVLRPGQPKRDGLLVRVEGTFFEESGDGVSHVLRLADGTVLFTAVLPGPGLATRLDPNTRLALVGVCQVQEELRPGSHGYAAEGFRIVLRSPEDITVLRHPPWWTVGRYQTLAVGAAALLGICLLGLAWLRRRVREQTAQIREALLTEARLEERYRQLIEGATDVIFRLDAAGVVTDWNPAGERLLGRPRSAVVGRALAGFAAPGREADAAGLLGEGPAARELVLRAADGRPVTLEVTTRRLDGGVEAIARDVTERRRLEEQLRQAAKMQAIGHLAGGVAHDFNNLLTVINGNCDLVVRDTDPRDPRRPLLEEVRTAGLKAAGVTRQLLAFGRQTVLAPTVLDLNDLLRGLAPVLTRLLGEKVTLAFRLDPTARPVRADGPSLEQVVLNLVVNARDAMPDGGTVTVTTVEAGDWDWVGLTVADTGIGMDDATRARLFEPYFTTKGPGKGTGLGLAVVQGVVDQTGGRIAVESAPGRGTTFTLEFPAAPDDAHPGTQPIAPSVLTDARLQEVILLVEDEPAVQLLERRVLEAGKYEVLAASSGEEALSLLDNHPGPIDLLVTDVVMPGMSGRELAEEVARRRPGLPALFLSGYTPDDVLRQGVESSAAHFLQKPFSPGALLRKVREVLAPRPG